MSDMLSASNMLRPRRLWKRSSNRPPESYAIIIPKHMSSARLWWPERSALCLLSGSHYGVRPRELFAVSAVTMQHYRREQERSATNARLVSAGASAPLENTALSGRRASSVNRPLSSSWLFPASSWMASLTAGSCLKLQGAPESSSSVLRQPRSRAPKSGRRNTDHFIVTVTRELKQQDQSHSQNCTCFCPCVDSAALALKDKCLQWKGQRWKRRWQGGEPIYVAFE
ncbi:hypothetical protein HHUSO_G30566 [Huso huso]|uniref:Uncharacterized protein n=1 Tax=Huso huso TaxID=61971 RepID=A0ABR0YD53_HUSHU